MFKETFIKKLEAWKFIIKFMSGSVTFFSPFPMLKNNYHINIVMLSFFVVLNQFAKQR